MEKRLKNYINFIREYLLQMHSSEEDNIILDDLLTQIGFFSHERLIHLLVTLSFAIFTVGSIITCLFVQSLALYILTLLFIILLIPYVRHYYILENGVQSLYKSYDELKKRTINSLQSQTSEIESYNL